MTTYTNGVYLQTFPIPEGPEWREALQEDVDRIEGAMQLERYAVTEKTWRDEQMPIAQQTVTALTYGEEGISGAVADWQSYWLALRKWTDTNPDFPDSSKRPVAPS
ncbi:hypothetical protein [Pseudomonas extremaustralis]|uniref:hypothetical protein n=1 Tax=Pseudomonas extremaustralis TaxID=359110 RepID=UPI002307FB89|nr:hypothetical protein [Pseudomonas extremaustralis]MDB1112842.1 hypothetical protein [Pseudomonas extremaustralis]